MDGSKQGKETVTEDINKASEKIYNAPEMEKWQNLSHYTYHVTFTITVTMVECIQILLPK